MVINTSDKTEEKVETAASLFYTKKFRLGDFLSEYIIKSVSFVSFAVIILIFVFVFREALPVFSSSEKKELKQEELQMETYGDESGSLQTATTVQQQPKSAEDASSAGQTGLKNFAGTVWQPVSEEPKYGLIPLFYRKL